MASPVRHPNREMPSTPSAWPRRTECNTLRSARTRRAKPQARMRGEDNQKLVGLAIDAAYDRTKPLQTQQSESWDKYYRVAQIHAVIPEIPTCKHRRGSSRYARIQPNDAMICACARQQARTTKEVRRKEPTAASPFLKWARKEIAHRSCAHRTESLWFHE